MEESGLKWYLDFESGIDLFIGKYEHILDTKNRVIVPSKFRENLEDRFFMTKGLDNCLFIYPEVEWKELESKLKKLPLTNREARAFVRFFFSGASECNLDKQGRVLIPRDLKEHSKIIRDIVIIGVASRIEIWSKEQWDRYNSNEGLSYENIAEKMYELGI